MAILVFGPFHLDTGALELRRDTRKIRLRPQPCRVLALLASRAGQLVTRQQIRQALWPIGVHVRFDLGLNSCLKQIRHALGDTGTTSGWIETLPARGYRFTGAVTPMDTALRRARLTVLPAQTSDRATQVLAEELTDELLTQLAQTDIPQLAVIDDSVLCGTQRVRHAVVAPRSTDVDVLLQWRVRSDAHQMRSTVRLLSAQDLRVLWAQAFEEPLTADLSSHTRLATAIALSVSSAIETTTLLPHLRTHLVGPVDDDVEGRQRTRLLDHRQNHDVGPGRAREHQRRVGPH